MGSARIRTTRKVSSITVALVIGSLLVFSALTSGAQAAKVPVLGWSPSTNGSFDFGTLDASLGQTGSHTFTLTNSDGKSSGLVTVTLTGSSTFSKTADTCTGKRLAPKKSCTVTTRYAPTNNGSNAATLTASSQNAANASLSLSGASAWQNGDLLTYTQAAWGTDATANGTLVADFNNIYLVFEVGSPGAAGFSMQFTDASHLTTYLPASGTPAALDSDQINPTSSSSGLFGGDVSALKLNVDFSDAGFTLGTSGIPFGNLTLCNLTSDTDLNGMTVRQVLGVVNTALGGGSTTDSIADLDPVTANLNASFGGGGLNNPFTEDHLQPGACP